MARFFMSGKASALTDFLHSNFIGEPATSGLN
jgi:hypothetical protein